MRRLRFSDRYLVPGVSKRGRTVWAGVLAVVAIGHVVSLVTDVLGVWGWAQKYLMAWLLW